MILNSIHSDLYKLNSFTLYIKNVLRLYLIGLCDVFVQKKSIFKPVFQFTKRIICSCERRHRLHPLVLLQVIAPEEIVDPNVDEHSVMTYLSQFPKSKLKPGAPLRAKTLHPKRAKAYGPGGENTAPQSI